MADKVVHGESVDPDLEIRFSRKLERYRNDPDAGQAVLRRMETARIVRDKIRALTGKDLGALLEGHDLSPEAR
jgi:hypothetical protein